MQERAWYSKFIYLLSETKMADSDRFSGWSTEVSFMDWPMCACVLTPTAGGR